MFADADCDVDHDITFINLLNLSLQMIASAERHASSCGWWVLVPFRVVLLFAKSDDFDLLQHSDRTSSVCRVGLRFRAGPDLTDITLELSFSSRRRSPPAHWAGPYSLAPRCRSGSAVGPPSFARLPSA